jgi:RNA polymerase sigma factor (sigma-70 family)
VSLIVYPNPESQLLAQYICGDSLSGSALADRLRYQVFYLVRQYTSTSEEAEDITQDCLLRIFEGMSTVDPERPLYPWICAIARNCSISWMRQQSRIKSIPLETVTETLTSENQFDSVVNGHIALLEKALACLEPLDRELLEQKYYHELNYTEIGAKVNLSADCVRKRISRALDRLQGDRSVMSVLEEEVKM